jgi:uncharacterized phage-associated protein
MPFDFDVEKSIQAIGVLYRADDVRLMNYMRLLKLLYIADRESYTAIGRPILGGDVFALPRGPVIQEAYDLIKEQHVGMPLWSEYYRRHNYNLHMIKMPDVGRLSEHEIETLQRVAKDHQDHDEWDLVNLTHTFQEWKQNDPRGSSKLIPTKDILEAVGQGGEADKIIAFARTSTEMRRLLVAR